MFGKLTETCSYQEFRYPMEAKATPDTEDNKAGRYFADRFNRKPFPVPMAITMTEGKLPNFLNKQLRHQHMISWNPFDYVFGMVDLTKSAATHEHLMKGTMVFAARKPQSIARRLVDVFIFAPLTGIAETIAAPFYTVINLVKAIFIATIGSLICLAAGKSPKKYALPAAKDLLMNVLSGVHATVRSAARIIPGLGHFISCGIDYTLSIGIHAVEKAASHILRKQEYTYLAV